MSRNIRRVGIIGLGKMGNPIARHVQAAGFDVIGYDVAEKATAQARNAGIATAASVKDIAASADFIIVLVGFDREVEQVLFGPGGIVGVAKPGTVIGIGATIAPRTMEKLSERIVGTGLELLDIPLCRGEQAAEDGKLLVMGGGNADSFAACKPVLSAFADSVFHIGKTGAGQVGKMVNNQILWACISINHEGLKLAEKLGVSPDALRLALVASSANNWALETRAEDRPVPWAEKDMTIVLREADRARISLPLSGALKEVIKGIKIERGLPTPAEPDA